MTSRPLEGPGGGQTPSGIDTEVKRNPLSSIRNLRLDTVATSAALDYHVKQTAGRFAIKPID